MSEQFQNPEEAKVQDEVVPISPAKKKIEIIADKAASKPAKTEQKYEKEQKIFTI
jgi:hypothetical protein